MNIDIITDRENLGVFTLRVIVLIKWTEVADAQ